MGAFTTALKDFAVEGLEHGAPWVRSAEEIFSRSKAGTAFLKLAKDTYEPSIAQIANRVRTTFNVNPDVAFHSARWQVDPYVWGPHKERLTQLINGARNELGDTYANNFADNLNIYFRTTGFPEHLRNAGVKPSRFTPPSQFEQKLKSGLSWMLTSRIVLPHMSQTLNSLLVNGVTANIKAMGEMFADRQLAKARVALSGALEYEMLHEMHQPSSMMGQILNKTLRQPGFSFLRRWQIVHSALAGKYAAKDAAERLLINPNSANAIAQLKLLGIDASSVLSAGGLTPNHIELAMYRSADEVMFIGRHLRTPYAWEENSTRRFAMMYRHWMFSEGKLISDTIKRNWGVAKKGNPLPLARTLGLLATLFPAVGEGLKLAEGLATGHDPTSEEFKNRNIAPLETAEKTITGTSSAVSAAGDEYLDAMSHAAGFGVMYSIARSAKRNALAEFFVGPMLSTVTDIGQDAWNMRGQALQKDFMSKIPVVGSAASNILLPPRARGRKKKESSEAVY